MAWTDERVETLKKLWSKGLSASQIAEELGEGVTRNAVIGKAHRLGLNARPSPLKSGGGAKKPAAKKTVAKKVAKKAAAKSAEPAKPAAAAKAKPASKPRESSIPVEGRIGLLDLTERICKWPLGHPGEPDFHFCGKKAAPGQPYCAHHCMIAYQAPQPRRDRRSGNRPTGR